MKKFRILPPNNPCMTTLHTNAARPRGRWLRRAGYATAFLVVALAAIVWRFGWWAPREYAPTTSLALSGAMLDSAGHDARVSLLDDGPYVLHIESKGASVGGGALLFFGSRHSKDPDHPQQAALRRVWEEFKPTIALVEGRMSFFVGAETQGIRLFGEGAVVYSLAERAGIPLYTLEPPLEVEIAALKEIGDRTQVALFRVLSGYMSARRGGPVSDFKIGRLLSRRAAPLTDALPDIAAFDAFFAAQFPQYPGWRDLPEQAMWPGRADTWLNLMATRANQVRDDHFNRTMLELTSRGERVLAIAGRSHTINLEPVLWESLQPAARGALSSARPWE